MNDRLLNRLQQLVDSTHPRGLEIALRKESDLFQFVESYWKLEWGEPHRYVEKIWHVLKNTNPMCPRGNRKGWNGMTHGPVWCQKQCACAQESKKQTMLSKYGVEHALQSKELQNKVKTIWIQKYGTAKLGHINLEQKAKTNIERYGAKTPLESKEVRQKGRDSYKGSTGFSNPFQNPCVQEGIQNSWLEKNGTRSYARSSEDLKKQHLDTLDIRFKDKKEYLLDIELFSQTLRTMSRLEMANFIGCSESLIDKRIKDWDLAEFQQGRSHYETVISNFLTANSIKFETNNRKLIAPKEVNWVLPDFKLGIEFCGLRWHGEKMNRMKDYHLNKLRSMNELGYNLITIFQDEWDNNSDIIKNIIFHKIGITSKTIYSRKCQLVDLDFKTYSNFMNLTHLQGHSLGDIARYGLILDNVLVAACGFRKHTTYQYEVSRHSTLLGHTVIGSFGRFLKKFVGCFSPQQLVSYADLRYFTGSSLQHYGFELNGNTDPGYWYTRGINKYHRSNFTKSKLVKLGYDSSLTEEQIMLDLNYDKIWDCGNARWIKNF